MPSTTSGRGSQIRFLLLPFIWLRRFILGTLLWVTFIGIAVGVIIALIVATNIFIATPRDVASRALDPDSPTCELNGPGWTVLADTNNSESNAIKGSTERSTVWRRAFRCAIQKHRVPGYITKGGRGPAVDLTYEIAFLEFKENGDPYLLCNDNDYDAGACDGVTFHPASGNEAPGDDLVEEKHRSQVDALLARLEKKNKKNYVIAFIHGWRHSAEISDQNVADLRIYAAHAARYLVDRCQQGDPRFCGMNVTAIYVGWRGARTDEMRLSRWGHAVASPFCGGKSCWLSDLFERWGTISAAFTLFDRKPVSEAIAPAVISALRAVENRIGLQAAQRQTDLSPCEYQSSGCATDDDNVSGQQSRMIVFGHSLGGNLLATGLLDTLLGEVQRHQPGEFVPPPLGNLVVLINPAAEASKWTAIQRAIRRRIVLAAGDKARDEELYQSRGFFQPDQRPVVISLTSARDWPPGGFRETDCADLVKLLDKQNAARARAKTLAARADTNDFILKEIADEIERQERNSNYDRATYDAFPAFRLDFRPLASSVERWGQYKPDLKGEIAGPLTKSKLLASAACAGAPAKQGRNWDRRMFDWLGRVVGGALRTWPFMNTDIEQTHTIGHLDPTRNAQSLLSEQNVSPRPFGTTHQLLAWPPRAAASVSDPMNPSAAREAADNLEPGHLYLAARDPEASCPIARYWLTKALEIRAGHVRRPGQSLRYDGWDAADVHDNPPALRFEHGYFPAHMAPITLGDDPFWNVRVINEVLVKHDGFLQEGFVCAVQQLVLDDVTRRGPPSASFEVPPAP